MTHNLQLMNEMRFYIEFVRIG